MCTRSDTLLPYTTVFRSRPRARLAAYVRDPAGLGGNLAKAAVSAGLVDRMGDEAAFGARVAEVAGDAPDDKAGDFAALDLKNYMKAHKPANGGEIGVLTIAGDIVDGEIGRAAWRERVWQYV